MPKLSPLTIGDGCRLAYRLDGPEDAPVLMLSNSIGTTLQMWDGQIEALSQRYRVLRYDTRGHGASDAPVLLEITGTMQDDPDTAPTPVPAVAAPTSVTPDAPRAGRPAPAFTRADAQGRPFALASERGHPAALFFFCGCPWCADVATLWGREQRKKSAPTVVVFAGTGAEARAFAARSGLDSGQTTLLPDPDSALTERVYKLNSCPRAFALDAAGLIRYTNDHADDQPRRAPAALIAQRTRQALGR